MQISVSYLHLFQLLVSVSLCLLSWIVKTSCLWLCISLSPLFISLDFLSLTLSAPYFYLSLCLCVNLSAPVPISLPLVSISLPLSQSLCNLSQSLFDMSQSFCLVSLSLSSPGTISLSLVSIFTPCLYPSAPCLILSAPCLNLCLLPLYLSGPVSISKPLSLSVWPPLSPLDVGWVCCLVLLKGGPLLANLAGYHTSHPPQINILFYFLKQEQLWRHWCLIDWFATLHPPPPNAIILLYLLNRNNCDVTDLYWLIWDTTSATSTSQHFFVLCTGTNGTPTDA